MVLSIGTERPPRWIPATALVCGLAFQALAWIIVLVQAFSPRAGLPLAWVHAVALGWITVTALAVILHVLRAMAERPWRLEPVARGSLVLVGAGAAVLVVGFVAGTEILVAGGMTAALGVSAYVAVALHSLSAPAPDGTARAIGRAIGATLCALLVTALLGTALTIAFVRSDPVLLALAPVHAITGIVLWLTVLTTGVSARTLVPMLGARTRLGLLHRLSGTALLAGGFIAAAAAAFAAVRTLGLAIVAAGVVAYATDIVDRLRRASTPAVHARVAVAAALSWLLVACAASLAAADPACARVAVVAALAGWAGSMVLAHLFHIGVRVLATATVGEDDETRPWDLLSAPLAFAAVAFYEAAVGALALGAWRFDAVPLATAGAAGLASLSLVVANGAFALRRASALAAVS
jgi:hypothetical protein